MARAVVGIVTRERQARGVRESHESKRREQVKENERERKRRK